MEKTVFSISWTRRLIKWSSVERWCGTGSPASTWRPTRGPRSGPLWEVSPPTIWSTCFLHYLSFKNKVQNELHFSAITCILLKNKVWYTCTLFIKEDINKHIACCSTRLYLIFVKEFDRAHISYISSSARGIGDKPTDRSSYAKIHKLKKGEDICVLHVFLWIPFYKHIQICSYVFMTAILPWISMTKMHLYLGCQRRSKTPE